MNYKHSQSIDSFFYAQLQDSISMLTFEVIDITEVE